jgi:hypothetical protein
VSRGSPAGYAGPACSLCAPDHYRLDLKCKKCPASPYGLIVAYSICITFFLALILIARRYGVNLAALSVGVVRRQ